MTVHRDVFNISAAAAEETIDAIREVLSVYTENVRGVDLPGRYFVEAPEMESISDTLDGVLKKLIALTIDARGQR